MKKELAIGICFGLAGILCTCLFGYEYFTTYGFLNAYHMKAFAASDTGYLPLLANILWERGKVFVIITILSLTALKAILPLLLRCLIYFTGGVFFAACVMNMGILGIVFFLVSWLPHGILYLAALALLLLVEPHRFYNRKIHGCCGWHGGWELWYWYFLDVYWRRLLESGWYVLL